MDEKRLLHSLHFLSYNDIYIYIIIAKYSVYYAHHMPHKEGTNPEMVMTIEHMWWLKQPKSNQIIYGKKGSNSIRYQGTSFISSSPPDDDASYYINRSLNNQDHLYFIDFQGSFIRYAVLYNVPEKK